MAPPRRAETQGWSPSTTRSRELFSPLAAQSRHRHGHLLPRVRPLTRAFVVRVRAPVLLDAARQASRLLDLPVRWRLSWEVSSRSGLEDGYPLTRRCQTQQSLTTVPARAYCQLVGSPLGYVQMVTISADLLNRNVHSRSGPSPAGHPSTRCSSRRRRWFVLGRMRVVRVYGGMPLASPKEGAIGEEREGECDRKPACHRGPHQPI